MMLIFARKWGLFGVPGRDERAMLLRHSSPVTLVSAEPYRRPFEKPPTVRCTKRTVASLLFPDLPVVVAKCSYYSTVDLAKALIAERASRSD
jgi:hypothetical protein